MKLSHWIFGGWYLFKFAWMLRFNFRHPYLRFRLELVFGDPTMKWNFCRVRRMFRFGYWAYCMQQRM